MYHEITAALEEPKRGCVCNRIIEIEKNKRTHTHTHTYEKIIFYTNF